LKFQIRHNADTSFRSLEIPSPFPFLLRNGRPKRKPVSTKKATNKQTNKQNKFQEYNEQKIKEDD